MSQDTISNSTTSTTTTSKSNQKRATSTSTTTTTTTTSLVHCRDRHRQNGSRSASYRTTQGMGFASSHHWRGFTFLREWIGVDWPTGKSLLPASDANKLLMVTSYTVIQYKYATKTWRCVLWCAVGDLLWDCSGELKWHGRSIHHWNPARNRGAKFSYWMPPW